MRARLLGAFVLALSASLAGLIVFPVSAQDYTSTSFILRDPITTEAGDRSTSASFEFYSSVAQTVTGEMTAASFAYRSGFLYFPTITSPAVTPTAGNGQVSLSWTASITTGGITVASYEVGQSTASGGPYTFTNVGNVLSSTQTGLSNGTSYFFVVRAIDPFNYPVATSTQVSATPSAPAPPPPPPSGGGGGGGGGGPPSGGAVTSVIFSGRAYPNSTVTLLKDAQVAATTLAGPDAKFQITLTGLSAGTYIFSLYGEDQDGVRSSLISFPVSVTAGATTNVSGILINPTIGVDKGTVKQGEPIAIFGYSTPQSNITITVNSHQPYYVRTDSDSDGAYLYNFDTTPLELGDHSTKSRTASEGQISEYSKAVAFVVGSESIPVEPLCGKADLNCDGRVNIVDFSIAAFWYKRALSPSFATLEKERLNGDGNIDIVDFSIMAYYWTG